MHKIRILGIISLVILSSLVLAQTLPISLEGQGSSSSQVFSASGTWTVKVAASDAVYLYLYDATTSENIAGLSADQQQTQQGNFFVYINTPNENTTWSLLLTNDLSARIPNAATPVATATASPALGVTQYSRAATTASSDLYNCSDFTDGYQAQQFFLAQGGPQNDPNDLDRDGDGYACEYDPRQTYTAPSTNSSSPCPAGQHWVQPYVRKDGANVKGHCRKS